MKPCLIFSGGTVAGCEYLPEGYGLTISADAGYLNALKFGIVPDLCIGDFDTLNVSIDPRCETIRVKPEKDDTDTMLCIKKAISLNYDSVYIYGAIGGRFDHTMANVQSLEYASLQGIKGYLIDSQNIVTVQGVGTETYRSIEGFKYFSILSLSERSVLSSDGLKYRLDGTTLTRDFPLGVSNEILKGVADVTVLQGLVLVSYSKD